MPAIRHSSPSSSRRAIMSNEQSLSSTKIVRVRSSANSVASATCSPVQVVLRTSRLKHDSTWQPERLFAGLGLRGEGCSECRVDELGKNTQCPVSRQDSGTPAQTHCSL